MHQNAPNGSIVPGDAIAYDQPGGTYGYDDQPVGLDLVAIWSAIYRMRFWVLGIIAASLLFGIVISILSTPIYQAEASVQIDQEAAKVIGTEESDSSSAVQDADRFLQTQLDILKSRSLADSVAKSLNLYDDDKFLVKMGGAPVDADSEKEKDRLRREAVMTVLSDNLDISLPPDSRVALIRFQSPDPALSAKIANSFVDNYIRNNLERKFNTSSYARDFLRQQLQEAATRLAESERKALEYSRLRQIVDVSNAPTSGDSSSGPKSLKAATLVELNSQLSKASAARVEAEQTWQAASRSPLLDLPDVQRNSSVQRLLEARATAQAEMEEQLQRRKDDHPELRQLAARIRELDKQINTIGSGIRTAIKRQYDVALAEENSLKGLMDQITRETLDQQSEAVQLGILQRGAQTDRELYDLLLKRYNEINAESGVQTNNVSVVDRAETPSDPVSPNVPLNLAVALLAGMMVAAAAVFLKEQFFNTIRTPDDVSRQLGSQPIGIVPNSGENLSVRDEVSNPKTPLAESFASLRTALMLSSTHGLPRSIMFTSAAQGEGKSTICYGVAVALARAGKKVVIIDLDMRRPRQHQFFQRVNKDGMSEVLSGNRALADAIWTDPESGVSVIPGGEIPPAPAELLTGNELADVIAKLQERFDVVLLDSPPLLGLADAVLIGSVAERCVFVIAAGANNPKSVRRALQRLRASGLDTAGFVLSRFNAKESGYGYNYGYELYTYEHRDD